MTYPWHAAYHLRLFRPLVLNYPVTFVPGSARCSSSLCLFFSVFFYFFILFFLLLLFTSFLSNDICSLSMTLEIIFTQYMRNRKIFKVWLIFIKIANVLLWQPCLKVRVQITLTFLCQDDFIIFGTHAAQVGTVDQRIKLTLLGLLNYSKDIYINDNDCTFIANNAALKIIIP